MQFRRGNRKGGEENAKIKEEKRKIEKNRNAEKE